jgi:hypothetical protein
VSLDFAWGITAGLALASLEILILKIVEYRKGDGK